MWAIETLSFRHDFNLNAQIIMVPLNIADSTRLHNLALYLHSSNGHGGTGAFWEGRDGPCFGACGGSSDVIDSDVDLRAERNH